MLTFREQLPADQLSWSFTTTDEFEQLIRSHLEDIVTRRAREREPSRDQPVGRETKTLWFGVPPLSASFTGREHELAALDEALAVADRAVIAQAIIGLGGVGKTQLASRYVHTHGADYDVVAWIRADDAVSDLSELAAALGEPVQGLSPIERRDLALAHLARGADRWLLVLDNVESVEQLQQNLPKAGNGRVLVTSRNLEVRHFGPLVSLDVFDSETATEYLTTRAQRPDERADAERLARALGYLPLALAQAAAFCATGTSFGDYLRLLQASSAGQFLESTPDVSYAQTVAATWRLSMDAADADAPLAASVLEMASYLDPYAIPKVIFDALIDREMAVQQSRLVEAFNALSRFSLVVLDHDTLTVHRLVQRIVRDELRTRGDDAAACRALTAVDDAFPSDLSVPTLWSACERLLPHVLAIAETTDQIKDLAPELIALLNRACRYLGRAEAGWRALAVAESTARKAQQLLTETDPNALMARHNLASAYQDAGRISDAIEIYESLLDTRQQILGPEYRDTLVTRSNLAGAYRDAGRLNDAIEIYESLLDTRARVFGSDSPDTLATRNNLAGAYRDTGRTRDAIAILEPLLAGLERTFGPEHPDTLAARNNLAGAYRDAGRIADAIAILEPLLAELVRIVGPEHPDTLATRNNLAGAYQAAGRTEEAIAILEPLLPERERILGPEHPSTLTTRSNLAIAYRDAGREEDALAVLSTR